MKLLVADDSASVRQVLVRYLTSWGHEVVQAQDGDAAWKFLSGESPPRVAILDWVMPGLEGVELCQRLQAQEREAFIYRILLTSRSEPEDLVRALEAGAHSFLAKPISPEVLRSHINVGVRLVEADHELQEYATRMETLAITDSLTGISNRRHFLESGEKEFGRVRRHARPFSVLLFDLDHFKQINDTHGHAAGDAMLCGVTAACKRILRQEDLLGRVGGEEFGIVLTESDADGAFAAGERLREEIATTRVSIEGALLQVTASIGVATLHTTDRGLEDLLRRADDAVYEAKRRGRNRVVAASTPTLRTR